MKPRTIFGNRDWNDVRDVVTRRVRRKFPRAGSLDIEDAVGGAMLDLVDYWIENPSSVDSENPDKTFWFACKRGTWIATSLLTTEWDDRPVAVDLADEEHFRQDASAPLWSPEDVVIAHEDARSLHRATGRQAAVAGEWLAPFLAGVTTREQARIEGVNQSAVARRWQHRMAVFAADTRSALGL